MQDERSTDLNQDFFEDNQFYREQMQQLETYQWMALSASHELEGVSSLLDIGNGGVFIYEIKAIPRVVAIDLFINPSSKIAYPHVEFINDSALTFNLEEKFERIAAVNLLHHVVGSSVKECYQNLDCLFGRFASHLSDNGRVVIIESTMPSWFVAVYKVAFSALCKIWPLTHPPTYQFTFRDLLAAAQKAGLHVREFAWMPKTSPVLFLGKRLPGWILPIKIAKLVLEKKHD